MSESRHLDEFGVTRTERDGVTLLELSGELDIAGVDQLAAAAAEIPRARAWWST